MGRKYIEPLEGNTVEDSIIIYYHSDNKPSSLGTQKDPGKIAKFSYAADGNLSSKILYNGSSFPLRKMDYHWMDGRIDIVKFLDYEIKGLAGLMKKKATRRGSKWCLKSSMMKKEM